MQGLAWQTRTEKSGAPDAGVVTITEFEKGEGVSTRQLRRLKGAFSGTIFEYQLNATGKSMKVTDGKFNLINGNYQK